MQISAGSPVLDLGGPSQIGISRVTNDVLRPEAALEGRGRPRLHASDSHAPERTSVWRGERLLDRP